MDAKKHEQGIGRDEIVGAKAGETKETDAVNPVFDPTF
jgi:hypothetical protein